METGKAYSGGFTLEELAKYVPMAHEIGERKFDKAKNRAVYWLTPPGESIRFKLVTAVDRSGRETFVTFYSNRRGEQTKKAARTAMLQQNARTPRTTRYDDTIHQLFGISNEIRGSFTPGEKFAESFQAVIELVKGKANVSTLCHESAHWLKALILETAAEKGLEVTCVHTTELKHFATGNGRAEKGEMVKAAFGLSGRLPRDDNEADALL